MTVYVYHFNLSIQGRGALFLFSNYLGHFFIFVIKWGIFYFPFFCSLLYSQFTFFSPISINFSATDDVFNTMISYIFTRWSTLQSLSNTCTKLNKRYKVLLNTPHFLLNTPHTPHHNTICTTNIALLFLCTTPITLLSSIVQSK